MENRWNPFLTPTLIFLSFFILTSCSVILGSAEPDNGPPIPAETFPLDRYVEGAPGGDIILHGGLFLWRNGNSWSVRAAKKVEWAQNPFWPVMTGTIQVENGIVILEKRQLNPSSEVFPKGNNGFSYRFELRDGIEGFDFRVQPTHPDYCLTLDMDFDGHEMPELVQLGSFMRPAETLPLKICLHSF